jgi:lysyl-tRNA synthetase class 2
MFEFDPKRMAKLAELRELGIEPYPNGLEISHSLNAVLMAGGDRENEALQADKTVFTIAGRLLFKNEMGKAGFARLRDQSGRLQIYVRRNDLPEDTWTTWRKLDMGDWVWAQGTLMRTRRGELSLSVTHLRLGAKCIESLPDKHKGFTDGEQRQRMRYLDLAINDDSRETFIKRSKIVRAIRDFFDARGFLEVETPMMQVLAGGATARPFKTHHNALSMDLYLRVAPELYLKRLVAGGFERVYEINRNFRNEGISLHHNPEFTMLEWYQAWSTYEDLMDLTEELITGLVEEVCGSTTLTYGDLELDFSRPWKRIPMAEAVAEATGLEDPMDLQAAHAWFIERHPGREAADLPQTPGKMLAELFDEAVEPHLLNPTFITAFPTEISPLSRRNDENPEIVDRFELFIAGREIANGFSELNDPVDQAGRFMEQAKAKAEGDDEAMFFDADYIKALSFGMPPTAGEGIGIDRLVMLLTNQQSIREVILFPTLRPKYTETAQVPEDQE